MLQKLKDNSTDGEVISKIKEAYDYESTLCVLQQKNTA